MLVVVEDTVDTVLEDSNCDSDDSATVKITCPWLRVLTGSIR